jgi:tRNA threonylcarbamoyl adenosine modification protein YjeE
MGDEADGPARAAELDRDALEAWGRRLGEAATRPGPGPGVLVALTGPLGAGKTTLVRAACRGAGVEGKVRSPTFTLHNHHRPPGRRPIHHVDLYRLSGPEDLDDLGWDELVDARGVVFVEWAGRAGERLPRDRWEIRLEPADDPSLRRVEARRVGDASPLPPPGGGTSGDAAGPGDDRDREHVAPPERGEARRGTPRC